MMDRDELFPAGPLIPHRHLMRLVEWVRKPAGETLQAEATVRDTWPLQRGGLVSSLICIELVAQAIAALRTWSGGEGTLARLGFVVGIKEAEFSNPGFPVGTRLFIDIAESYHVGEYAVYEGRVHSHSGFTGTITLQAMEPKAEILPDFTARQGIRPREKEEKS